ncbi:MAG: ribonuclease E inhibitor RraB [Steroidobacteraceae bacterium]
MLVNAILVLMLGVIAARIYFKWRAVQRLRVAGWDEQIIERLRRRGYAPFTDYAVDFFFALPDEPACQAVREQLEPEFRVDVKDMEGDSHLPFSLHATKTMRLILPEMQALSRRMTALATEHHGRYDGWAA